MSEFRTDGALLNAYNSLLANNNTGLGVAGRDKLMATAIVSPNYLNRPELQILYRNSAICAKVVDLLPRASTSENWIECTIGKGRKGRKGIPAKAKQYAEDLKLRHKIREAAILGRLEGDAFIILGVDDGQLPEEPVREDRIYKISWVEVLDRYQIQPEYSTGRPGHPEFYRFWVPRNQALTTRSGELSVGRIHRSRVLRIPGKRLYGEMIANNNGYHDSVLQAFYQVFVKYLTATEYSARMVQDYNLFTYKLKGLASLVLQGKEQALLSRFTSILMGMSTLGGLAMDEGEEANFISRNYSGLDKIIEQMKDDTSAAAGMPPTQLWGVSAKSALSNSSTGDKYAWADCVDDYRAEVFDEPATDFFRLIFLAKDGPTGGRIPEEWDIHYRSILKLNLQEQVTLRKEQAQGVDKPYVDMGVLLSEEIRESAWGGSEYTIERTLDPALWDKKQAEKEQQQAPPPQPEEGLAPAPEDGQAAEEPAIAQEEQPFVTDDATPAKRIIDWHGFQLGLQYQPFDLRHGKVLPVAYGHIRRTRGADGMAVDCYVGSDLDSDRVFEITQLVDGEFDEHKMMLGFSDLNEAREVFLQLMPAEMFGGIREIGLQGLEQYRVSVEVKADDWHEDKLCGKSSIPDNRICHKGVDPSHPASNPNHKKHAEWLAATSGGSSGGGNTPAKPAAKKTTAKKPAAKPAPDGGDAPQKTTKGKGKKAAQPVETEEQKKKRERDELLSSPTTAVKAGEVIEGEGINAGSKQKITSEPPKEHGGEILNYKASNQAGIPVTAVSRINNLPFLARDWDSFSAADKASSLEDAFTHLNALAKNQANPGGIREKYGKAAELIAGELYDRMSDKEKDQWARSMTGTMDSPATSPTVKRIQDEMNQRHSQIQQTEQAKPKQKSQKPKQSEPDDLDLLLGGDDDTPKSKSIGPDDMDLDALLNWDGDAPSSSSGGSKQQPTAQQKTDLTNYASMSSGKVTDIDRKKVADDLDEWGVYAVKKVAEYGANVPMGDIREAGLAWMAGNLNSGSLARAVRGNKFPEDEDYLAVKDKDGALQSFAILEKVTGSYVKIAGLYSNPRSITGEGGVKGAGSRAILQAVKESEAQGFEGRVRLAPIPSAIGFYKKLGFKQIFGNTWELSPDDAKALAQKMGAS